MGSSESFGELARHAMERAVAWREAGDALPPRPSATPEELRALFDVGLPAAGRCALEVIDALAAAAERGLVGNVNPNFFGWVMGASHPAGVAADWLAAAWGQNAGIFDTAPAAAVSEEVAAGWLLELLDLPRESSVGFTTGATAASTICLAAARFRVLQRAGYDLDRDGVFGAPEVRVLLGEEAHATIFSGLRYLGFGEANIARLPVDGQGRMRAAALSRALEAFAGPKIVVCQAGHIHSGDFDPFREIVPRARQSGAWCHVDGAFGLWARSVPGLRQLCEGVGAADSWSVDGHKWLQVPYDCGFAIVRDTEAHLRTMDTSASYLAQAAGRSPSRYCLELSRRARGFAVWAVIQALGREGIEEMVTRHCRCARHLQALLQGEAGVTVLNEVVLNQLAIAFGGELPLAERDRLTGGVLAELARENRVFVEGSRWRGQRVLRVSVISHRTTLDDMARLGKAILRAWRRVRPAC
jgi:glutamate/tyrosine decarboxylase-like PLP-dependent enzyme